MHLGIYVQWILVFQYGRGAPHVVFVPPGISPLKLRFPFSKKLWLTDLQRWVWGVQNQHCPLHKCGRSIRLRNNGFLFPKFVWLALRKNIGRYGWWWVGKFCRSTAFEKSYNVKEILKTHLQKQVVIQPLANRSPLPAPPCTPSPIHPWDRASLQPSMCTPSARFRSSPSSGQNHTWGTCRFNGSAAP